MKKGDFVPAGFEVSFSAIDDLKAMRIRLSEDEKLQLKGRIDRLDLCEDEEHIYVKIIDYKSGSTSFDLAALLRPSASAGGVHGCCIRDAGAEESGKGRPYLRGFSITTLRIR